MTVCAYCKQDRAATREHVIPSFLYAFQKTSGEGVIGWNEVVEKMVGGEAKVKDVCADCNNRVLGALDAYGKDMLLNAELLVHNYLKTTLTLKFEYTQLLRWLLKISFNSARTDGAHSHLFERFIPFILAGQSTPSRSKVAVLAYLAAPIPIDQLHAEQQPFRNAAMGARSLNPFIVRICYGHVPGENSYTLRINILGPLVFYMLIFDEETLPGHASSAIRRFLKLARGAIEISPMRRLVTLQAGQKTWLDLYAHQIQRTKLLSSRE